MTTVLAVIWAQLTASYHASDAPAQNEKTLVVNLLKSRENHEETKDPLWRRGGITIIDPWA